MSTTEPPVFSIKEEGDESSGGTTTEEFPLFSKRGCCFWLPCLDRSSSTVGSTWWENRTAENNQYQDHWWNRGWKAVKKVREWSEIIAGPKWKTFIRRFNKNNNYNGRHGKYQYDPLSYALNFDEGGGQNGDSDDDDNIAGFRNFSVRYAALPVSAKSSMDLGKDGPAFT
ncbi:hypothetical protein GIB67_016532 [Kingdonia uniflora]|uniref:Uncharacterized protein n=1 Tax=Kingdonia uniflora TaxID=39325 RepID=A0A7J7NQX2_9MAGN|nr:hypothetical protein GIB67_016532 [Kingdonia uniflora]